MPLVNQAVNDISEGILGKAVRSIREAFGPRVSTNGAFNKTAEEMITKNTKMLEVMKGLASGATDKETAQQVIKNFKGNFGMEYKDAVSRMFGEGKGADVSVLDSKINYLTNDIGKSSMDSFEKMRAVNVALGNGNKMGAGNWAKGVSNYYTLGDLKGANGKLKWNMNNVETIGARYGTSIAGVWGAGHIAGNMLGGDDD